MSSSHITLNLKVFSNISESSGMFYMNHDFSCSNAIIYFLSRVCITHVFTDLSMRLLYLTVEIIMCFQTENGFYVTYVIL